MTMGGPAYMQVGNETYSLMVTEEDMEKRRTERERQKRLSQETNRRRKALEDRKKLAVEREARKRSLELSKRKQRQTEATERYQRSHIGIKHDKRAKFHGGIKSVPSLDNVLQQLRSGSTEIVYPYQTNSNSEFSTQLTDHVKSQFELELAEQKQRVLEQHKQQTMQEFNNELKAETVPTAIPFSGTMYNANVNSYPTHQHQELPKSNFQYSNVDIMSGRAVNSNDQFIEPTGLAGSLSRLFVEQEDNYSKEKGEPIQYEEREKFSNHFTSKADIVVPSGGRPTKENENNSVSYQNNKVEDSFDTGFDDQDSLHGNSPVASPVFNNHLTSFQRKYFSDVEVALKQNAPANAATPHRFTNGIKQDQQHAESKPNENQKTTYYSASSPVTRAPPNYYVKSYRPWSTTEASNVQSDWPTSKPIITRPLSAAPTVQSAPSSENADSKRIVVSSQSQQPASKPWSAPVMHVSIPTSMQFVSNYATATLNQHTTTESVITEKEPMHNRWMTKTTATPISTFLSKTQSPLPESTPVKQPELVSRQSVTQKQKPAAAVLTEANPLPVPTDRQKVSFSPGEDEKPIAESTPIKDRATPSSQVKSILRKVSKYGGKSTYPVYRAAGVVARNQWVESVNNSPYQTANAKLRNTEVRDSIEVRKVEGKKAGKSVMWNEIQYNDGTSVSIATPGIIVKPEAPVSPAPAVKNASPRGGKSAKGKQAKAKPKAAAPAKGGKKGGKQNRKLKPAKEVALPMEPRPPTTKKKQLVMATSINYSVPSGDYPEPSESTSHNQAQSNVSWTSKEQDVTMDTLKSSGSSENLDSPPLISSTIRNGNQVTIHMMKADASNSKAIEIDEEQPSLDKTPTDQEISWLWDKVRSCLAQRPSSRVQQQPNNFLRKTASDTNRFGGTARRSAWNASVAPTIQQQQASIVSIDGGLLSPDNMLVKPIRNRRLVRPTSAVQLSSKVPNGASDSYGAFMRRQALLQQRRHKHYMSRGVKPDMMRNFANYPSPKPSYNAPLPSPSSAGSKEHMSDSTTAFLLAETLAEQNLSEDQIIHAMDSLQKRTRDAQKLGKQVMASALSQEEQRLLASLERLNTRLREVEETVSKNPLASSGPFFNVPQHQIPVYKHHVQRSVSADARYQRSRLRY